MKKITFNKIYCLLRKYVTLFLCLFGVYVGSYAFITSVIFKNFYFPLNYLGYMLLISCIISLIIMVILQFNRLNFILQYLLIYVVVTASIYFIGFFTNIFIQNVSFWIFSLIINLCGLCVLLGYVIIRRTIENKDLNNQLKKYQGGDKE